jgi:hypothetical protein
MFGGSFLVTVSVLIASDPKTPGLTVLSVPYCSVLTVLYRTRCATVLKQCAGAGNIYEDQYSLSDGL